MITHAPLSPSKRHRWSLCPGSVREEAKYPEERSHPSAIDGTHTHSLFEKCLKEGVYDPFKYVGQTLTDHDGSFKVDQDRAARVSVALRYVMQRAVEFNGMVKISSESMVDPDWFVYRKDLSGHVDCTIDTKGILEIIDYKDGMNLVSAIENPQLEQYAIGKLAECRLGWNTPELYPWHTIRMTIIQPKLALKRLDPIMTWEVPIEYILKQASVLWQHAKRTDDPEAPLVPGETQCKYCRAKLCSARANTALSEVGIMFQPNNVVNVSNPMDIVQQSASKDPSTMSDSQLSQVLEAAPLLRQLIEQVEEEVEHRLKSGVPVPGYKLVAGRGSRVWSIEEDELVKKLKRLGIPKEALYTSKFVSPAQLEKLVWDKKGTDEKMRLSAEQLARIEREFVSHLTGKATVVPDADERPAITTDVSSLFMPVQQSTDVQLPSWLIGV